MIRIQAANNPGGVTIAIDGQLIGDYAAEIEASVRKSMEQCKGVHLFLRNVSHIDDAGRELLTRLAALGVELSAAGVYSSHIVAQVQRALIPAGAGEVAKGRPIEKSSAPCFGV